MRGDERLPQADAAVAGRHLGVKIHFKILFAQRGKQQPEQQNILKTAAAEAYAIQPMRFAKFLRKPEK